MNTYARFGFLGAAGVLAADMAGGTATVRNLAPTAQKLARVAVGGVVVALVHKFLLPKAG